MKSDGRQVHGVGTRRRPTRIAIAFLQCLAIALALPIVQASPASAAVSVTAKAAVTPGVAHNGTPLTLTVTTTDTKCVEVTHNGQTTKQSDNQGLNVWTFNLTAGQGDGPKNIDVTAWEHKDCKQATASTSASYVLDNTAPTITGRPAPAANVNGWNNTDVTVTFTCGDSGSGIVSCPNPRILTTEGTAAPVSGAAIDAAGNTASATVTGIRIDKTRPTLSGAPTTAPNGAGWYNANVAVKWSCSDALSGIDGACPADSAITGEGEALSSSASVHDKAGNSTSATSPTVKIDRTAPVTQASAPPAWNNTDVTVTLTGADGLSGVATTNWKLDGGTTQTGTSVPVSSEGKHTLEYSSVDNAGNAETAQTVQINIDKTSPTISHTQSPAAVNGWNNTDVTVTFTCDDALSGIASCTEPTTLTTGGQNQSVPGEAIDHAGNTVQDHATVSIDKTKPEITAKRDRQPNDNGWYNDDVTVTYTCDDALSGVVTCPAAQTLGEGANRSATGTVNDAAGNTASATQSGINIDKTKPTITGTPTTAPNADGWYRGNVTIHWTCDDNLSGIVDCPVDSVIGSNGRSLTVAASVTDRAGNTTSATSLPVNVDRNAPTTTSEAPSGWQRESVTVRFNATDDFSGVKTTSFSVDGNDPQAGTSVTITKEGGSVIKFWSEDMAGNVEAERSVEVRIDQSLPTIGHSQLPAPNGNGWNNGDVTVTFTCADQVDLSGLASCTTPQTLTTEGEGQAVEGTAIDTAGNQASDIATINIDKTAPNIAAQADRAPNGNGWYKADVTVGFSCDDAVSGVASCPTDQTFTEGDDQSAPGSAVDNADNSATTKLDHINVDETAPTISGKPTSAANSAGWYRNDVAVAWRCDDTLSGIDGDCPANSTIEGEGQALSASATVADKAGNSSSGSVDVKIDRTAPTTNAEAPSQWVNDGVTVALDAADNLSGVGATRYVLDGHDEESGSSVEITSEGTHKLEYWSVDVAGNEESPHRITISIDKSAPTIRYSKSPLANEGGWNNTDVTVTFTCEDQAELSGIASCTTPQTLKTEGQSQAVEGIASDRAGNKTSMTASVSIDKTVPTISGTADRAANENGWYNKDVSVNFVCDDELSGVRSCTTTETLAEGADQSVMGTAVDAADNSGEATVGGINVDKTPPTIAGVATTQPNGAGWYRGEVVVHWTCTDALSGIAAGTCPADTVVNGEGNNLSATASVTDLAGNRASASVAGIKIDRTAPVTNPEAPSGWQKSDVTVRFAGTDKLSGVATTWYSIGGGPALEGGSVTLTAEGTHSLEYWSADAAGNEEAQKTVVVRIDKTAPSITGVPTTNPNAAGWYQSDVVVHWTCTDALSGIAGTCPADTVVKGEGNNLSATASVTDNAGNQQSGTVGGIKIDRTAPNVTVNGIADGSTYTLGAVPTPSCVAVDPLSGTAGCTGTRNGGNSNGVGSFTYTATATDSAGNTTTTEAVTYRVVYAFSGFKEPIDAPGHTSSAPTSIFKAGSTVPVKFDLRRADGSLVQPVTAPQWITPVKVSSVSAPVDESVYNDAATTGESYKAADGGWHYNWSTKGVAAGNVYKIGVRLDDGTTQTVYIGLK
jgi:large repetitive protein